MHALLTPAVLLLSGVITGNAGYITLTSIAKGVHVVILSRSLKSSDDLIQNQVCHVTCFFIIIIIIVNHGKTMANHVFTMVQPYGQPSLTMVLPYGLTAWLTI